MSERTRYLLALYIAEHRGEPPVSSGTVAEMVGRTPGTTTQMFQSLADDGLIEYERYEGATLTETGRERATDLHETYVTLSWFFRRVLDLEEHETEAMELAGVLTPDVAERLAAALMADEETETPFGEAPEPDWEQDTREEQDAGSE